MNRPDDLQTCYRLDKTRIRDSFDRAAVMYDEVALLQREVADRLLERLDIIRLQPRTILDVGSGTGYCARNLAKRYKKSDIISLDLAPGMLRYARGRAGWMERLRNRQRFVCGDAERLPLADDSVDMILSNLALQWCDDLDRVYREFMRVLRPGGLLMFTTFGPDTLKELRASWAAVDGATHVSRFIDMHDIGDALMRARFADPVMDMEYFTLTYGDVRALMRDLKQLGARNATDGRSPGLTGKGRLRAMATAYERYRRDGVLPATYEVAYGHAWVAEVKTKGDEAHRGVTRIPVEQIGHWR